MDAETKKKIREAAAARKRKSREAQRKDPVKWEHHLKKEIERNRTRRMKMKECISKCSKTRDRQREQIRARVQRFRDKKKKLIAEEVKENLSKLGSYKCIQTLQKAVVKAKKSLPESPLKQQAVVMQLAKAVLPVKSLLSCKEKIRPKALSEEEITIVRKYFERDDISRQSPSRKDVITIRGEGTLTKTKLIKRHLIMTVAEVYALFQIEHPDIKIGKSKFFELRPVHVRPMSEIPHNVCVCKYHANFQYLINAVNKFLPSFYSSKDYLQEICCDVNNKDCMMQNCESCFDIWGILPLDIDLTPEIQWNQWDSSSGDWLQVKTQSGTRKKLLTVLQKQTEKFKSHCFVKNEQQKFFEVTKNKTTKTSALLQVDFAENYSIITQDEIQSTHWRHPQVTLFTGCCWFEKGKECRSYVIISNNLSHDKEAVWLFTKTILDDIKRAYPEIRNLTIMTDGSAAQFKNRFTLSNVCFSEEDWGLKTDWVFFATSHGKGAVDGIGATAKRRLWSVTKTRKVQINTAWDCYKYLSNDPKGIKYFFVAEDDINPFKDMLQERWDNIRQIPEIQKNHYFTHINGNYIGFGVTSYAELWKVMIFKDKVSYAEVYTDSDMENSTAEPESIPSSNEPEVTPRDSINEPEATPSCSRNEPEVTPSGSNNESEITQSGSNIQSILKQGSYVLVEIPSMGKKIIKHRYVAVCQDVPEEDEEVKVMFLRTAGGHQAKTYTTDETDIAYIPIDQIIQQLSAPTIKVSGNRIYYEFPQAIDIFEK